MLTIASYSPKLLPGMAEVWGAAFADLPALSPAQGRALRLGSGQALAAPSREVMERDLLGRVIRQPSFDDSDLLVARQGAQVVGFVHFGQRSNLWYHLRERQMDRSEGQVYALVAPPGDQELMTLLLRSAVGRLREAGATRVLLGTSWVYGTQPFYNGIAGGYELPGLDSTRHTLLQVAAAQGFVEETGYGTPELDLANEQHTASLRGEGQRLMEAAQGWGLRKTTVTLEPWFFPGRRAVVLQSDGQTAATTAYGPWQEYTRAYGTRMFGITSVHVSEGWRGRGLGKLIMILAAEEARQAGAEALHLHVWEENKPAWNLYHHALGFQPTRRWVTLVNALAS